MAKCRACDGTGKAWSYALQRFHPSKDCFWCKGTGKEQTKDSPSPTIPEG